MLKSAFANWKFIVLLLFTIWVVVNDLLFDVEIGQKVHSHLKSWQLDRGLWVAINGRHMRFLVVFKCTANQA
jgi:hypothetical protein